ncbi:LysR family transcriptional regulator [Petroclostridium sp. X23]|uniref:LysR family transcriptional regulator n=1 Tax=Petroclostridium sp. X23 TaxID=3045146 RepID=UPI0024AE75AB|nr:LysR family transcriptional regulator [Petroclostridium sp. X23]WHH60618.1 LysR family transcriptional regulator [Petroclostridium sp. X23]
MNTLHFKYAIEVERTKSISQAAENLFMGQPNLSKAIKELEKTLGFAIFERTPKGVVKTQKGSEFLVYARNVMLQIEKMEALSDRANENVQSFNISIPRASYITGAVTQFVSELDQTLDINVNVQETNAMRTIGNITNGAFNLGIIRYQKEYENYFFNYLSEKQLTYEPIWEFEYLAVMSENHPLANVDNIEHDGFKKYTEIVHKDTSGPYMPKGNVQNHNHDKDISKKIYVCERCSQFDLLSAIPTTYMWVCPIPEKWLVKYNLIQRKCKAPGHVHKDLLIFSKSYKLTEVDFRFVNILFESKNEVSFKEYK